MCTSFLPHPVTGHRGHIRICEKSHEIAKRPPKNPYTPLPTALSDDLDSFRGLGTAPRFAVKDFELALPEAVVESRDVSWDGDAAHPDAPRFRISLMSGRASNASKTPSRSAVLKLSIMTTGSHARLISEAHMECHSLNFPPGSPRAAPTIIDILALVQLVSERKSNLKDTTTDRSATAVYMCAALEDIFGGLSKDELGRANELGVDTKTTLDNDYSYDDKEVGAVVDGFPSKRSQLQSRMDRDAGLAALKQETAALKAEIVLWTEEAARLELKLAAFVGDGLVVMSARRK
ncbi:hypothetical protein FB451DRAFT_1243918 [Mycena latifolia]|nr:hypothetical protein FB451DRAFT_1243918 [Mycena latifolia]